ncbi:MAG: rRNA maturation RNase YbeY [Anaerolineae bacterium]|nr:rRNA maturation RNase YbeY [Anaerolineae bacterium]
MREVQSSKLKAQSSKPGHRINIQVAPHFGAKVDEVALRRLAAEVLGREEVAEGTELSLIITDDEAIRELNRRFRGVDAPTDVLAFGAGAEEQFVSAPESPPYLGDVVISYQRALAQAEELGHTAAEELKLLVIHGILHLLGYDHQEQAAARKMREREERILSIGVRNQVFG